MTALVVLWVDSFCLDLGLIFSLLEHMAGCLFDLIERDKSYYLCVKFLVSREGLLIDCFCKVLKTRDTELENAPSC